MKPLFALLSVFAVFLTSAAENLIINGDFSHVMWGVPSGWGGADSSMVLLEKGIAPGGKNAVTVKGKTIYYRQGGLRLVAGAEYELSAFVKISGKDPVSGQVCVINRGWNDAFGPETKGVPQDGKWHRITQKFKMMKSKGTYDVVLCFLAKGNTSISFTDVTLRALDPAVAKKSRKFIDDPIRDIIPLSPLLYEIPEEKPVVTVLLGNMGTGPFFCRYSVDKGTEKSVPFRTAYAELPLGKVSPGPHTLTLKLTDAKGTVRFSETHPIKIWKKMPVSTAGHKRLNNLTVSLLEKTIKGKTELTFCNPRVGWVYFDFPKGSKVSLDGKAIRYARFVRCLPEGEHKLTVEGPEGKAAIRAIPAIHVCSFTHSNLIRGAGDFGWEFTKKYMLPGVTLYTCWKFPEQHRKEALERGILHLHNVDKIVHLMAARNDKKMLARMAECDRIHRNFTGGGTPDELYWNEPGTILWFARTSLRHPIPEGWIFSPWFAGHITRSPATVDALSSLLNRTAAPSLIYHEAYCVQQRTPEAAKKYLHQELVKISQDFKLLCPAGWERFALILGSFNQLPIISAEFYPDCDYKYFLDMQFRLLTTHPELKGLGGVGYWGSYYGDEEMTRWVSRLMYHYVIEGKTEMLSPRYGFQFKANYLKNTDFEEGLKHWTASGPEVKPLKLPKFGRYQQRWQAPKGLGDTCVLLKGGSSVKQTATGLVPGKLYRIKYVTAFYDVIRKADRKAKVADDGIRLKISGVTELPEKLYEGGLMRPSNLAMLIHRRVFRANGSTAEFEFRNDKAGAESVMNFVQLTPYYPDEDFAKN